MVPRRLRHADRRLGDPAGRVLRRVRVQGHLRLVPPRRVRALAPLVRHLGWFGRTRRRRRRRARVPCPRAGRTCPPRRITRVRLGLYLGHDFCHAEPAALASSRRRRRARVDGRRRRIERRTRSPGSPICTETRRVATEALVAPRRAADHPDKLCPARLVLIEEGSVTRRVSTRPALATAARTGRRLEQDVDGLLTLAATGEAPEGLAAPATRFSTGSGRCSACPADHPLPRGRTGLPIGVQFIGRRWQGQGSCSSASGEPSPRRSTRPSGRRPLVPGSALGFVAQHASATRRS